MSTKHAEYSVWIVWCVHPCCSGAAPRRTRSQWTSFVLTMETLSSILLKFWRSHSFKSQSSFWLSIILHSGAALMFSMSTLLKITARQGTILLMIDRSYFISLDGTHSSYLAPCPEVGLYCAGFPCTPYSLLHWGTRLLEEEAAKPMWQCIRNVKEASPGVACPTF